MPSGFEGRDRNPMIDGTSTRCSFRFEESGCTRGVLWTAKVRFLHFLIQSRRDKAAALKSMRKLLKTHGFAPRVVVTTNCDPTLRHSGNFDCQRGMSRGSGRTNGPRTLISLSDDVSEKCSASSPPDQLSAFSPSTPPSTTTSTSNVTRFPDPHSAPSGQKQCGAGTVPSQSDLLLIAECFVRLHKLTCQCPTSPSCGRATAGARLASTNFAGDRRGRRPGRGRMRS